MGERQGELSTERLGQSADAGMVNGVTRYASLI